MRKRLTDLVVQKEAPPATGRLEIFDDVVPSMALRITANGARSFVVRCRVKGEANPIRVTLGDASAMKLADARQAASEALRQCRQGIHPSQPKRDAVAKDVLRWETAVETFIEKHAKRNRAWQNVQALFANQVTPAWNGRALSDIGRADVVALLDRVEAKYSVYHANRVLAAVRKLFNWAVLRGMIPASPIVQGMAREGEEARDRYLTLDEIAAVWRGAQRLGYPFGPFVQMLLLTGQRRSEVADLRWAAIDLEARTWTLDATDTKAGRRHAVPLSDMALDILAPLPRLTDGAGVASPYVFTTNGRSPVSGFSKAKMILDREMGAAGASLPEWRFHDLRRTVATHMGDVLGIAPHIIGAVLNHAAQGVTQKVYARGTLEFDKRRALQAWARLLHVLTEGGEPWRRIAPILHPRTEAEAAQTAELRRALLADDGVWQAHLQTLTAERAAAA